MDDHVVQVTRRREFRLGGWSFGCWSACRASAAVPLCGPNCWVDAITDGYQSTTSNGYRGPLYYELQAEGYPLDFVGSVWAGTMSDPDNEGHSGGRIDQIAGLTDSSLATSKPNVITLMIGTNDLGQNHQVSSSSPAACEAAPVNDHRVKEDR